MFKKMTTIMLLTACTNAVADQKELTFAVEAEIPSARYYVEFMEPTWGSAPQTMDFNIYTDVLEQIGTDLRVRNTAGKISAHLASDAKLVHVADQTTEIPLDITIGGTALKVGSTNPVDLTTAATVTEELKPLAVSPAAGASYAVTGKYAGDITMMFDFEI